MRGSKLILLSLFVASNVFALTPLEVASNNVAAAIYPSTNWPPPGAERHFDYSRLTNMGPAATFRLLRHDGWSVTGPNDAAFLNTSNAVCITNIPGISGSGFFIHQNGVISNAGTIYVSYTNRSVQNDSDTDLIQSVRLWATYVTNEATIANPGLGQYYLNLTAATNRFISGDLFMFTGNNFHISYFNNRIAPIIESNSLGGAYTAEDYLGRAWINTKKVGFPGGALDDMANNGYGLQIAQHGTLWEFGWAFESETKIRVWAGPNQVTRTLDGLTQWQPMRSCWWEYVTPDSGTTNRAIGLLVHAISIYYHKTGGLAPGSIYDETNNAKPYGAQSFRGNVVTGNEGSFDTLSVTNPPTQPTNVVNLAAMQNALRTNGAVGSVTQTNFNLLQIYTNSSGLVQAYSGRVGLVPAAVVGNAGILAFLSRDNGTTFAAVGGVSEGTAIGITVAPTTNGFFFALNTNDQCYFTNISSGIGNSAGLVSGSGQITLMGASIASTLTNQNSVTAQYLIGDTNSRPFVYTNYTTAGTSVTNVIHTNSTLSSSIFTMSVWGNGIVSANTNVAGINFGRVFSNVPSIFMQHANASTGNGTTLIGTIAWHPSGITTSNFNVTAGPATTLVGNLTNVYQFLVIGQ